MGPIDLPPVLFWISKLLEPFLWPLNAALICLGVGLVWRRRTHLLSAIAFGILVIAGMPVLSNALRLHWEGQIPPRPIAEYPAAQAIVLLGGTVAELHSPRLQVEELSGSRVLTAQRLFRAGKAPLILVSDGVVYPDDRGADRVGADDMRDLLIDLGVPDSAIQRERESRTTYENAVYCARLLRQQGLTRILLVTSALHLPRAAALFRKQGLDVVPVPNSFEALRMPLHFADLFPDAMNLLATTHWVKEVAGYWAYRLLGKASAR